MQTITTKYLPHTNTKPRRIKATCAGGASVTISYPMDDMDDEQAHWQAANKLAKSLNWTGDMTCGSTKTGYVFVFSKDQKFTIAKAVQS